MVKISTIDKQLPTCDEFAKWENIKIFFLIFFAICLFFEIEVHAHKNYLGTVILPGFKTSMEALKSNTAQLPSVSIEKPKDTMGALKAFIGEL